MLSIRGKQVLRMAVCWRLTCPFVLVLGIMRRYQDNGILRGEEAGSCLPGSELYGLVLLYLDV